MAEAKSHSLLFLASQPEDQHGVRDLFEQQGYEVNCRDSGKRGMQYLSVSEVDLVICDWELRDLTGISLCRQLRMHKELQAVPVVVIGDEVEGGKNCIAALEAGADDFIEVPFIPDVLVARAARLVRRLSGSDAGTMSVHVEAGQLPGILQYLETDNRSGTLTITSKDQFAILYFREGRLVNARTDCCEELEVISEVLSWSSSDVTFHEGKIEESDVVYDHEVTGTLMHCVVAVDEFREIQKNLPPPQALFTRRSSTTVELSEQEKAITDQAMNGHAIAELIQQPDLTPRQATLVLHSLLERGVLLAEEGPFVDYQARQYEQYHSRRTLETTVKRIRDVLTDVQFPLPEQPESLPLSRQDWVVPAPRVVLSGDNPEHLQVLLQSFRLLSAATTGETPRTQRGRKGEDRVRLAFAPDLPFDIQVIPNQLDKEGAETLPEYLFDACAVIFVVSKQDHDACRENLRMLRLLRQQFRGVYYLVVPQVANSAGIYEFRMDCNHCGYRLAVDMSLSGSMGECPICNETITIPDPLEHLTYTLKIPSEVPAVMIKPDIERHVRDLLLFIFQSIQKGLRAPRKRKKGKKKAIPTVQMQAPDDIKSSRVLELSEVKARTGTDFDIHAVDSHDAAAVTNDSSTVVMDPNVEPDSEIEVPEASDGAKASETEAAEAAVPDKGTKKLHIKLMPKQDERVEDVQRVLDEIMADEPRVGIADSEPPFDLDEFIRQISTPSA